ncbi:MAG: hypothetical protein JWQ69_4342 [Pseudomonas sp.]|nr:hypothetical protein [Pseudomonas sp.]
MNPVIHPTGKAPDDVEVLEHNEMLPVALAFEAGRGDEHHHTHKTIEAVLSKVGFSDDEREAVYFGNWLRDYSQLLDPKIVRGELDKDFPNLLSREALTQIVDVLAVREFTEQRKTSPGSFTVTPDILGVYRPSEHIDNPKALKPTPADPTTRDPDFEPWVLADDPLLKVDYSSSQKLYIARSVETMQRELQTAMKEGRSAAGLRAFGVALHILEDFFAHSNFVELSLIKEGYPDVLPWTSKAECRHGLPLVTGLFGSADAVASLAGPLGEILFSTKDVSFESTKSGFRSERDKVMLILLSEHHDSSWLQSYNTFLEARDQWAELPVSETVEKLIWVTGSPARLLGNAFDTAMQGVLKVLGNSIDDFQTLVDDDPNTSDSTDPSHSQLAKDLDDHPLHELAAKLAEEAVLRVGQAMLGYWEGKFGVNPIPVATAYFVHPWDSDWQRETVAQWAAENESRVKRSADKTDLDGLRKGLVESRKRGLERLVEDGKALQKTLSGDPDVQTAAKVLEILTRSPLQRLVNFFNPK